MSYPETMPPIPTELPPVIVMDPAQILDEFPKKFSQVHAEVAKAVVGQETAVDAALWALFARGHCLLVGVPGLAKTLLVHALARALELSFSRIQFTPDLMPSDIT